MTPGGPQGEVAIGFREGWVRYLRVWLPPAGVIGLLLAAVEMLHRQPVQGFGLLQAWGPWPLVAMLALWIVGSFLDRANKTMQVTFGSMVDSAQKGAQAQLQSAEALGRQADAMARLADQGGRQAEEVRRLAIYAGRELGSIAERLDKQDVVLEEVARGVKGMHARLAGKQRAEEEL